MSKIACISYVGYNYIQRDTSISNSYNVKTLDAIDAYLDRYDFYKENNVSSKVRHINLIRCYYVLYAIYESADFKSEPLLSRLIECSSEIKKRSRSLWKEPLLFGQRIFLAMNYISPYYTWRLKNYKKWRNK